MAPRFGILLLSCAALAYEVLLTRLFAIVQWSHFAAIAISLALLGFGAGGSLVALLRRWLQPRFEFAFMVSAIGFAVAAPASFVLAQHMPFNPLELAWDYRQLGWLSLQFLLLSLPFLAVGCAIGMALSFRSSEVGRLYAYDLAGAAMGAGLILLLLAMLAPVQALAVVSLLGVLAALVARREMALSRGWDAAVLALIGLATYPTFILLEAEPSPYKDLSQARQVLGAKVLLEHSGVEGVFSVVRNDSIPIRHAPGISLGAATPIPEQMALFLNGDSLGALTRFDGDPDSLIFTDYLVSALPYALVQNPRVLLLDGAGGLPLLQAIHHGAESIEVVERIPGRGKLLRQRLAAFSGNVYERAGVQEYIAFPRHVLDAGTGRLDLILLDRTLGGPPVAPGLDAAEADWVLTREAFERALALLGEGGFVAIAHWLSLPPKTSLRLFNTAREALAESGHADQRLVYLRGWKTGLLLLAKDPITGEQIDKVSRFARSRSFDIAFRPNADPVTSCADANRYNRLERPAYCQGMQALLGSQSGEFVANYAFDIRPSTDDRPFAHRFMRWGELPRLLRLEAQSGYSQIDWGLALLAVTLAQAIPLAGLLIVVPLFWRSAPTRSGRWPTLIYFAAIGVGFMAFEIACLQQLQRFLGEPVYALSLTLAGFLLFAGLGSSQAERLQRFAGGRAIALLAAAILVVALLQWSLADVIFSQTADLALLPRMFLALFWLAPLAVLLGLPLPLGMSRLRDAALLPWAWAINGCASVIGAVLAALMIVEFGFAVTMIVAGAFYLVASLAGVSSERHAEG